MQNILQKAYCIVCALVSAAVLNSAQPVQAQESVTPDSLYKYLEHAPKMDSLHIEEWDLPSIPYRSWLADWFAMTPSTRPARLDLPKAMPMPSKELTSLRLDNPLQSVFQIERIAEGYQLDENLFQMIMASYPQLFKDTYSDLEAHRITAEKVNAQEVAITTTPAVEVLDNDPISGLRRFMAPRKYWTPGWNSVLQFSQNYISENWHKGGSSNLNLFCRQHFKLDYKRDRLSWNNELEWRLSLFTSPSDTIGRYRVADDLVRLHTNVGLQAVKNLFYTLDAEVRTQAFTMREENKRLALSDLLSPIVATVGLGMKYVYEYKSPTHYGHKVRFEVNLAPIAYDFRWTQRHDIDLARHGFKEGKTLYSAIGSMLRADLLWDITESIRWQSRFYYNTSYKRVETEWENAFIFALSKFFSTRLNVHLRFDDAAAHKENLLSRIQINQLLSFGFEMNI